MNGFLSLQYLLLILAGLIVVLFSIDGLVSIKNFLIGFVNSLDVYRANLAGGFGG